MRFSSEGFLTPVTWNMQRPCLAVWYACCRLADEAAKFYAAQVLLAFEYLHCQNIIYRDLKVHVRFNSVSTNVLFIDPNEITSRFALPAGESTAHGGGKLEGRRLWFCKIRWPYKAHVHALRHS